MPWFSPPHAFVHQGSRPTEIYGRLCLIQLYALQDEACTSMCLSDAIIQHERMAVLRVRGSDCWHSRRYVTMAGKAEQQGGFGMEPLCSHGSGRKNCIAGVSSGPVQTAKDFETGLGSRCHRPQSAHGCCSNGDCGGGTHPHSTTLLHVSTQLLEKACWRRSLSRSVRIFAHPEDQQCRLPGPEAVTPRAMDSFATPTKREESMPSTWS